MRNSQRRRLSPLNIWRAQYSYLSKQIRATKDAVSEGNLTVSTMHNEGVPARLVHSKQFYSDFQIARIVRRSKVAKTTTMNQRALVYLRSEATRMMKARDGYRQAAQLLWENSQRDSV